MSVNSQKLKNLIKKKTGSGISQSKIKKIIGKKLTKNVSKNYLLKYSDLQ